MMTEKLTKEEKNRRLNLNAEERKLERDREKQKLYQEALTKYPLLRSLSAIQAIKYKKALDAYPDLQSIGNTKLILLAYDFRQEQVKSYHSDYTTELANGRCNVQIGSYKNNVFIPNDLPILQFEK